MSILILAVVIGGDVFPEVQLLSNWMCDKLQMLFYYIVGFVIVDGIKKYSERTDFPKFFMILMPVLYFTKVMLTFWGVDYPVLTIALSISIFGFILTAPLKVVSNSTTYVVSKISKYSYGIYLSHIMLVSLLVKTGIPYRLPLLIEPIIMMVAVLIIDMLCLYALEKLRVEKYVM